MRTLASICCLWIVVMLGTEESNQLECYNSLKAQNDACQHQHTHPIGILQPGQNGSMEATGQWNSTYTMHDHPDANYTGRPFQHCLIFQYLVEAKPDETGCDEVFRCDNSLLLGHPDRVHLVQYRGSMAHLYCCTQDNCNGDDQLKAIQSKPPDLPCTKDDYDGPQMVVRKRLISKPHYQDILVYSCDDTNICSTHQLDINQCKNVTTSTAEETTEMCCCDSVSCSTTNSPSTASIIPSDQTSSSRTPPPLHVNPLGPMPPKTSPEHTKWRFVAGISGAMVLALLVLVLVFIVVKKYRAHKRGPVTYSYNQLTADLAEEKETEDENMIVA